MAKKLAPSSSADMVLQTPFAPEPLPARQNLYVGIDIGKASVMAGFLSESLLEKHKRWEKCPVLPIDQSRAGFEQLLTYMRAHCPLEHLRVLMERTGHYGYALLQYLQEQGIAVFLTTPLERLNYRKTDRRDALGLANLLYNYLEKDVKPPREARVQQVVEPTATATVLRGLAQHHYELSHEITRHKNKLTAICDEVFPELTAIYDDPNSPSALQLRLKFPTPQAVIAASIDDLCATRKRNQPSRAKLLQLQQLATTSIGVKNEHRLRSVMIEQEQLIKELMLIQEHEELLTTEIEQALVGSREGRILLSFVGIGPTHAATLLARIGTIANFESMAKLRAYLGWAPVETQTGVSKDRVVLSWASSGLLKQTMYLIAISAIKYDPTWRALYDRLVPRKCQWDERKQKYIGKMKVIGRIAGQIIGVIYLLLKKDYDLLQALAPGQEAPEPTLYSVATHRVSDHDPEAAKSRRATEQKAERKSVKDLQVQLAQAQAEVEQLRAQIREQQEGK